MKQYTLFKHPSGTTEAVKRGWSWPAFFFGSIWAIAKKMYVLGACVFISSFLIGMAVGLAGGGDIASAFLNLLGLAVSVVFGVNGNDWRQRNLVSRGFAAVGTISATTPDEAIAMHVTSPSPMVVRAQGAAV